MNGSGAEKKQEYKKENRTPGDAAYVSISRFL
jgi:hypothetical protein